MATNRTRKEMLALWADGAVDLPGTPIIGTTYGRSTITDIIIEGGWPFGATVESATFNEMMRRMTYLLEQMEQQGVLSWSSAITYAAGALAVGSNGEVYRSWEAANINHDPTTSPTWWKIITVAEPYLHCADQKANGVNGGSFVAGAWRTRDLNTVYNSASWAALASNQLTLQAGNYRILATAPAFWVDIHKLRLRNITDGTTTIVGTTENTTTDHSTTAILRGEFSISSAKVFEIQHRCDLTSNTYGFGSGSAVGYGEVEKYTDVEIWRLP